LVVLNLGNDILQCTTALAVPMMPWIRGPAWDGFWILSGLPLGLALTLLVVLGLPSAFLVLWLVLLTQTGHLLSPMALAWTHDGFRTGMLRRPIKYVAIPIAILVGSALTGFLGGRELSHLHVDPISFAVSVGPMTWAQFHNPFMAIVAFYGAWNAYHFGKQAFGVLSIYRQRRGGYGALQRRIDLLYSCAVVWAAMAMPFIPKIAEGFHNLTGWLSPAILGYVQPVYMGTAFLLIAAMLLREFSQGGSAPRAIFILTDGLALVVVWWAGLWGLAILALNHWLVAIGLASHVHANHARCSSWLFALALMAAGLAVFCLLFVDVRQLPTDGFAPQVLHFTVAAVGFRLGLGFVHFLYDRWIYKFSDPKVSTTIGLALFSRTRASDGLGL
jgi:hypothetical protein